MKIIKKTTDNTVKFSSIEIGEVFLHNENVYMRLPKFKLLCDESIIRNATSLAKGEVYTFQPEVLVKRVLAELTVTEIPCDDTLF